MATSEQVKNYLAYWFQLGKQVVTDDGKTCYRPATVIQGDRFSPEFEQCWSDILQNVGAGYYLKGTDQTIDELLSSKWDVVNCARCDMLVPMPEVMLEPPPCPCNDLPSWPNEDLPKPRLPVDSHRQLSAMRVRLASSFSED